MTVEIECMKSGGKYSSVKVFKQFENYDKLLSSPRLSDMTNHTALVTVLLGQS